MEDAVHKKWWMKPERLIIFGLIIALVFTLTGFEISSASIPDSNGVIHGCLKGKKNQLFIIDTAKTPSCPINETPVNWGGPAPSQPGRLLYQKTVYFTGPYVLGQTVATFTAIPAGLMCLQAAATAYSTVAGSQIGVTFSATPFAVYPHVELGILATEANSHKALVPLGLNSSAPCASVPAGTVSYIYGGNNNNPGSDSTDLGNLSVEVYSQ